MDIEENKNILNRCIVESISVPIDLDNVDLNRYRKAIKEILKILEKNKEDITYLEEREKYLEKRREQIIKEFRENTVNKEYIKNEIDKCEIELQKLKETEKYYSISEFELSVKITSYKKLLEENNI